MQRNQKQPPEDMIAKLMLAAGFLMEEVSPELAIPIEPTREAVEVRIAPVERAAEDLGDIAAAARTILRLVRQ